MPPPFHPFGALHAITVAIVLATIVVVVGLARRGSLERARRGGRIFAVVLVAYYVVESVVRVGWLGTPPILLLPMELCSALFFVGAAALWTGHAYLLEILVLWALAGTVHALITPTPGAGFPSIEYVRYFVCHGLLVMAALYAALALELRMTPWSILRVSIALQLWELVVAGVDLALDQNFMYLRRPPPSPTLIDSLGPWPWYLGSLELVAIVSFALWAGVVSIPPRVSAARASRAAAASPAA
jgi:hypothetical integral membrane protein (TIGR02206 family)